MYQALERVKSNKGAPGIDGITTEQLDDYLRENWLACKEKILKGTYIPAPVKRVEIPKPDGGKRMLGIPIVLDRLIQQAILQKLTPIFDPEFSAHSYGFRPGRGTHDAVRQARRNIEAGHEYVVDMDIKKFFDRVNHDILMSRVARKVKDKLVLKLIRAYLNSGVMIEGVCVRTEIGTPQGGPLSPLLANILLDDLDKELEKRGHRFCRYADDCNIYVKSPRAGERVLTGITEFLEKKLKLKINREKSGVGLVSQRKFLGFSFVLSRERGVRIVISPQSLKRLKGKIKRLTRSKWSISMEERIRRLNSYLNGWLGYYALADTIYSLKDFDGWIRRRLRKCLSLIHI